MFYFDKEKYHGVTNHYYFKLSRNSNFKDFCFEAIVEYKIERFWCNYMIIYFDAKLMTTDELREDIKLCKPLKWYTCVCQGMQLLSKKHEHECMFEILDQLYKYPIQLNYPYQPILSKTIKNEYYIQHHKLKSDHLYERFPVHIPIYIIDPPQCEDADDGFSFDSYHNMLYIHIADPTYYIHDNEDGFKFLEYLNTKLQTFYPRHEKPNHLLPKYIRERTTLNKDFSKFKNYNHMITLCFHVHHNTREITYKQIKLYKFDSRNVIYSMTYKTASIKQDEVLETCLNIAKINLPKIMKHIDFKDLPNIISVKTFDKHGHYIPFSQKELQMKKMIEYLAILANKTIAEKYDLILRSCERERGQYQSKDNKQDSTYHSKLNLQKYAHFTSPMRRFLDLILHLHIKQSCYNQYPYLLNKLNQLDKNHSLYFENICTHVNQLNISHRWIQSIISKILMLHYFNLCVYSSKNINFVFEIQPTSFKKEILLLKKIKSKTFEHTFELFYIGVFNPSIIQNRKIILNTYDHSLFSLYNINDNQYYFDKLNSS